MNSDRILNIRVSTRLFALLEINITKYRYKIIKINISIVKFNDLFLRNEIINEIIFKLCSHSFSISYYLLNRSYRFVKLDIPII